ncbi:hypothetical protein HZ326_29602 [Fusarium oxysporum f. sp. albedinis]|nr:hypothetical protein HZ326_29602 [Fusarium oxysporum f. sp. albedinis]
MTGLSSSQLIFNCKWMIQPPIGWFPPSLRPSLEKLHLHLNLPEKAVICTRCGYALAVDDDRVGRHLGQKHDVSKGARRKLNTLINSLQLPNPEQLPKRSDSSAPHPTQEFLSETYWVSCF